MNLNSIELYVMLKLLNAEMKAALWYQRAERYWSEGKLRLALRFFLAAAKAGCVPAFEKVTQFYDNRTGVKANRDSALHWYLRAYREEGPWYRRKYRLGLSSSANNIGCILRDQQNLKAALSWFKRAVTLGDDDANLQIAKIYLRSERNRKKAIHYLRKTIEGEYVTDGSIGEARRLLKQLQKNDRQRGSASTSRSSRSVAPRGEREVVKRAKAAKL